jgi:ubiquinone/menaquinone biosynthesis C-methylase UbiE
MKSWEETIVYIRSKPEYKNLVEKAYFEENLSLNVERFKNSIEFAETVKLLKKYNKTGTKILDIGCGNGISSIAFSLNGYAVTAVEPDPSETIGAGAIKKLIDFYNLKNIIVFESYAEDIGFKDETFDVVYIRQAMHHANNLNKFISESARVLKKGGVLLTIRDHVIFDEEDKKAFLDYHPLQKYYGGENAYKSSEYENAMTLAGLKIEKKIKTFENEINYFPITKSNIRKSKIKKVIGSVIIKLIPFLVSKSFKKEINDLLDERVYLGRMYSYVAIKK